MHRFDQSLRCDEKRENGELWFRFHLHDLSVRAQWIYCKITNLQFARDGECLSTCSGSLQLVQRSALLSQVLSEHTILQRYA